MVGFTSSLKKITSLRGKSYFFSQITTQDFYTSAAQMLMSAKYTDLYNKSINKDWEVSRAVMTLAKTITGRLTNYALGVCIAEAEESSCRSKL